MMKFSMYVNGQKCFYDISATKILLKSEMLDIVSVKSEMQKMAINNPYEIYDLSDNLFMIDIQEITEDSLTHLLKKWNSLESVLYASPDNLDETGKEVSGLTNQVLVRLKSEYDHPVLKKALEFPYIRN